MTSSPIPLSGGIRQLAFVVPDAEAAARQHSELTGSGPFLLFAHYELAVHEYRGTASALDVTSAYGQWGDIQVEFVQCHDDAPSAYRDTYPDGGPGMHHAAVFCEDLQESREALEAAGYPIVLFASRDGGTPYAMFDTRPALGFMLELYEESMVGGFYEHVRELARDWDGADPVRARDFTTL